MNKTYFVISDVHGYYSEMVESLKINNYDMKNPLHHLIVLGDLFDRGTQSKEVLEFMYKLRIDNKVTIILGNHETFLIDFLDGNYARAVFNMKHNGFKQTLESLCGKKLTFNEDWNEISFQIKEKYIYIYNFLKTLPLYIEIDNYIFVHGGIKYDNIDWKKNLCRDFIWSRESEFNRVPNKTVVCGHERVSTIRYPKMDQKNLYLTNPEAFDILKSEGKIHIDAYVEISKKINVLKLILKDEGV